MESTHPARARLPALVALAALGLMLAAGCGDDAPDSERPTATATRAAGPTGDAGGPTGDDRNDGYERPPADETTESEGSGAGVQAPEAPEIGEELPQKPAKQRRIRVPRVVIDAGTCGPRSVRVPARSSLTVRNRDGRKARFQVPAIGTDLEVPEGRTVHVLLPSGAHDFVCRVDGAGTTEGTVRVAARGG